MSRPSFTVVRADGATAAVPLPGPEVERFAEGQPVFLAIPAGVEGDKLAALLRCAAQPILTPAQQGTIGRTQPPAQPPGDQP